MAIGKVIKGDVAPPSDAERGGSVIRQAPRPGVLSAEDFEARQTGNRIIDEAKQRAEDIVEEAMQEREKILAAAKEEGRQEGLTQAAEILTRAKLQAGQALASDVMEQEVLELSCRIAEKIIGRDLERDPSILADICAQAVDQVRSARAVTLRVNPEDGRMLRSVTPRLMELVARSVDIAIRDDAEVEVGGCIVQTEFGTIDAQLKTQLDMIRNVLLMDGKKQPSEGPA